jgi:hypothetical protein
MALLCRLLVPCLSVSCLGAAGVLAAVPAVWVVGCVVRRSLCGCGFGKEDENERQVAYWNQQQVAGLSPPCLPPISSVCKLPALRVFGALFLCPVWGRSAGRGIGLSGACVACVDVSSSHGMVFATMQS